MEPEQVTEQRVPTGQEVPGAPVGKKSNLRSRHGSRERLRRRRDRRDQRGDAWGLTICLRDGPKSSQEIQDTFLGVGRRFGFFSPPFDDEHVRGELSEQLGHDLEKLTEGGYVVLQDEKYALTPLGRIQADRVVAESQFAFSRFWEMARPLAQPQTAVKVAVFVEIVLTAVKLPAALLSGSVGLLNDSADTLLDLFSSFFVCLGLRFNKERAVNVALVLLMLGTGSYTLYEAVGRFFAPYTPEVEWFPFLAAVLSAIVCAGLWAYQRFVGLRGGNMALITQSIDSRNHVIVAVSVTAGLIASILHFGLLDTLVGLGVAVLILKSAVELGIECVRSRGEALDLSHYQFWFVDKYDQFRQTQFRDWMLRLVQNQEARTKPKLIAQGQAALDFGANPMLQIMGLDQVPRADEIINRSIAELVERGWVQGEERLSITDAGEQYMNQKKYRVGRR
jgi:hypothetical protein